MLVVRNCLGAFALAFAAGCSGNGESPAERDLAAWMKANPPVNDATWAKYAKLICRPKVMEACGPDSCKAAEPAAFVVWQPRDGKYQRCDGSGCNTYIPTVAHGGSFTNLALPHNAGLFKVSADLRYTEVVGLMDLTLVYRGKCEPG